MHSRFPRFSLALAAVFALTCTLHAQTGAISVRVEQDSTMPKVEGAKPAAPAAPAKPDPKNKTQHRGLNIFVTNNSKDSADLKVKHIIFGREVEKHDVVTLGEGENPVTVKPASTEKVVVPPITANSTMAGYDAKSKKKTEASGATIMGYGVQVLQADKVVAEAYDPPSLKEQWGKTIQIVPPTPKK
jgi:hypothetical protein